MWRLLDRRLKSADAPFPRLSDFCSLAWRFSELGLAKSWKLIANSRLPLRQSQHALANDIALNLAGAAGDRVLPGAEHAIHPTRRVRDRFKRLVSNGEVA